METDSDQIARARAIATFAHAGQVDKSGADYITHPRRVAERLVVEDGSCVAVSAAWLHDVIEDCGITGAELVEQGIAPEIVEVVELLTRRDDVPSDHYYAAIREHPDALAVKLADIADNTDPARVGLLDEETRERLRRKYLHALESLGAGAGELHARLSDG